MEDVIITEYDPSWPSLYAREAESLRAALGNTLVAVEHVGSTAVTGLAAKPVIDLLAVVDLLPDAVQAVPALSVEGYEYLGENGIPGRLFFRKGVPRTHHLNVIEHGHQRVSQRRPQWRDNLEFRDYLRAHPDEAARYEALKRDLAQRFRHQREDYTNGKSAYILSVIQKARAKSPQPRITGE